MAINDIICSKHLSISYYGRENADIALLQANYGLGHRINVGAFRATV